MSLKSLVHSLQVRNNSYKQQAYGSRVLYDITIGTAVQLEQQDISLHLNY